MTLYHYTNSTAKSLILSPKKFGEYSHTSNDLRIASTKRIFFYSNPSFKKLDVGDAVGGDLFKVDVDSALIYNLETDALGLIKKSVPKYAAAPDYDTLFKLVKKAGYKGMSYSYASGMTIVAWFSQILVRRCPK